uniref:LOB domain-containing protein n=1 Tax=Oryza meridionalis TaxID=40149 RepID=A0A0E0CZJ8_9ORYZ
MAAMLEKGGGSRGRKRRRGPEAMAQGAQGAPLQPEAATTGIRWRCTGLAWDALGGVRDEGEEDGVAKEHEVVGLFGIGDGVEGLDTGHHVFPASTLGVAASMALKARTPCRELPAQQRGDEVSNLVYEVNAQMRDPVPVYGCVEAISFLQNQASQLQMQLAAAQAEILCIQDATPRRQREREECKRERRERRGEGEKVLTWTS